MEKSEKRRIFHRFVKQLISEKFLFIHQDTEQVYYYNERKGIYELYSFEIFLSDMYERFGQEETIPVTSIKECFASISGLLWKSKPKDTKPERDTVVFQNGVYFAKEYKLRPHTPKRRTTICINRKCPPVKKFKILLEKYHGSLLKQFLDDFTGKEKRAVDMIFEFFGLAMSNIPGYLTKSALFLQSKKGNSGKSVLLRLLIDIIGRDYVEDVDLRKLEGRWGPGRCFGKRLICCGDQSVSSLAELPNFKKMTGGDPVFGEEKGSKGFSYVFDGVFLYLANQLPLFDGDSGRSVYDRFLIYESEFSAPKEKQDKFLFNKICEECGDILTVKCLEGLKRFIDRGYEFDPPESCQKSLREYEIENNEFALFFRECVSPLPVVFDENLAPISTRGFFITYANWYRQNGKKYRYSRKDAMKWLTENGVGETRLVNGIRYFTKITVDIHTELEYFNENTDMLAKRLKSVPKGWGKGND